MIDYLSNLSHPDTGETELKEVVQTFVRETNELVHIKVNGEEIITTPTHPFWVPQKGWTDAIQLRAGDRLQLLNGEYVIIEQVQHEILEAPVTVYNFEVEDFHTYYVGDISVLVHNKCIDNATKVAKRFTGDQDAVIQLAKEAKRRGGITSNEADILWNWAKEYDLVNLYPRSYHPPKFDSYQGGRVKHLKINGMHINILDP